LYAHALRADGSLVRLDAAGGPAPLTLDGVEAAVGKLDVPIAALTLMTGEDGYYYGRKRPVELPVFRAVVGDAERTRLYIGAESGDVRAVGPSGRAARWIRTGLHGLDFPVLRTRPLWDVVVIVLLAGVTSVCATGSWMAIQRVARDVRRWRRVLRRSLVGRAARA